MGAILALVLLLLFGVESLLGRSADESREDAAARRSLRTVLENMDISFETFQQDAEDYLRSHPNAPESVDLERYLEVAQELEAERVRVETQLNRYMQDPRTLPESEVRSGLLSLMRLHPEDDALELRVRHRLAQLDAQRTAAEEDAFEETRSEVERLLDARDPAAALRRLSAFRAAWPAFDASVRERVVALEERAAGLSEDIGSKVLAAADAETDPRALRTLLAEAWPGLAGTPIGDRIADRIRFSGGSSPRPSSTGSGPDAPTPSDVLTRAAEAESLVSSRRWPEAVAALEALLAEAAPGPLRDEWSFRLDEVRDILALTEALGTAARADAPLERRLGDGVVVVEGADGRSVTWRQADATRQVDWADVDRDDLLALLTPARPTPGQRIAVAVLAADLGRRQTVVDMLLPLIAEDGPQQEAAGLVAARHLFGRVAPPEGGYLVYQGQILDRTAYDRLMREERVAELVAAAEAAFEKIRNDAAFKKLDKLGEMRVELDKRRHAALLAIFNEKHYPYPYARGQPPYTIVQGEIDRRVALVREIWDDPARVKISRTRALGHQFDLWESALAELRLLDADAVRPLLTKMAPYAAYATGEPITIREFFVDGRERNLLEYNRWVMETFNVEQTQYASTPERRQVEVTNEYRMMMGYSAQVEPGPDAYDAIAPETVAKILDGARLIRTTPLRAVRVDDRLTAAARGHSEDMGRRGYFAHQSKPNPATGDPGKSPFQRMQEAGYKGGGASENICAGATAPEEAHDRWAHSSGHHRNLLMPWADMGAGQSGRLWTQNFGSGGGRPTVIEEGSGEAGSGGRTPR